MKVLVLGATGSVGRLVVAESVSRGHDVTGLARSPQAGAESPPRARFVQGDARDLTAVSNALAGQDAVIYALGAGNVRQTTLFSDTTGTLLDGMERQSVRRLICVTGVGAGETKGHGGFLYDRVLYPLFTKGVYQDKDRQEALIRQSGTDWTIVRPASFRRSGPAGPLRAVVTVGDVTLRGISRLEVATFIVDELEHGRYLRQAVFIGHE